MTKDIYKDADGDGPELDKVEAKRYRSLAARINYLAQDRPDLSLASCLLAGRMATPRVGDMAHVKKVVRYLTGFPDAATLFRWQEPGASLTGTSESDRATCPKTRVSKSGGTVARGLHLRHHW